MSEDLGITVKKADFGEWYLEVVKKCQIIDQRYNVKGFVVYMPWGMFLIDKITQALYGKLVETGHKPVSFPVVIPESNLKKEAEHVKSFEKEVFWITHAGENKLDERLLLRPTSETAFYPLYALWIRSYKDLPLKLFQTAQIYRYETKMTKPLMRGREFFWIETHTAHSSWDNAAKQVEEDMKISNDVFSNYLGIPFLVFKRPDWDKFPGAEYTYAYDTLLPDGKVLQIATTHHLGQKFSKAFDIKFANEKGSEEYAYQTCFGPGTSRIAASIISVHGDDKGMVLPPAASPVQVVIIPIIMKGDEKKVMDACISMKEKLHFRVEIDGSDKRPGFKFNEWEMKGVPVRVEIGPRDVAAKQLTIYRRDTQEKITIKESAAVKEIESMLGDIFANMKKKAQQAFERRIHSASSLNELKSKLDSGGFVRCGLCSMSEEKCAAIIEKETSAKVRGELLGKDEQPKGKCIGCGNPAKHVVYVARAY